MARRLIGIYLNDHLAGATLAVELTRRAARANEGTPLGVFLRTLLLPDLTEDRETLERLMMTLGIMRSRPKLVAARVAEMAGRLKLNGALRRYSPLSRLLELEGLVAVVELQRCLWLTLADELPAHRSDFVRLAERAESQRSLLEEHRRAAAETAFRYPHDDAGPAAPSGRAA